MAWQALKAAVTAVITDNNNNEITGPVLETLFNSNVIDQLGEGKYQGVATPSTTPIASPESEIFYFAYENGQYVNLGGHTVNDQLAIIRWNTSTNQWVRDNILDIADIKEYSSSRYVELNYGGLNKLDVNESEEESFINSSGDRIDNFATYDLSSYIKVSDGENYVLSRDVSGVRNTASARWVVYYDENLNVVDTGDVQNVVTWQIPSGQNIRYQRISYRGDDVLPQLELGTVISSTYEAPFLVPETRNGTKSKSIQLVGATIEGEKDTSDAVLSKQTIQSLDTLLEQAINNKYDFLVDTFASQNLLDINTNLILDAFVNSSTGNITTGVSGWACAWVDVSALQGQQITFSGNRERVGRAFHSDNSGNSIISGTYGSSSTLPVTFTVPANAERFYLNVYSPTQPNYSNLQVEAGDTATTYRPFGNYYEFDTTVLPGGVSLLSDDTIVLNLDLATNAISSIVTNLGSRLFTRRLRASRDISDADRSASIELENYFLDGTLIHSQNDESAPVRLMGTTIGANHGYAKTRITDASHGKTNVDLGSIWADDNGKEFVLIKVLTSDILEFTSRLDNTHVSESTLTHVSGATNTSTVDTSNRVGDQWYNVIKNHSKKFFVDGIEVNSSGAYTGYEKVEIKETYQIMQKNSMVSEIIAGNFVVGSEGGVVVEGNAAPMINTVFDFGVDGGCTIHTNFIALNETALPFQDIMFIQQNRIVTPYTYYIPKTLPVTHNGFNYDFTNPTDLNDDAWTSRLNFTPSVTEPNGLLADRVVELNTSLNFGFAIGYLPIGSNDPSVRRTNASRKALQLSNTSKKVYPSTIDRSDKTTFVKGDNYSAVGYKVYFELSTERTAFYVVDNSGDYYVYADWHNMTKLDIVNMANKYNSFEIEVIETRNVNVLGSVCNGNITYDVTSPSDYAYAIIRLHK